MGTSRNASGATTHQQSKTDQHLAKLLGKEESNLISTILRNKNELVRHDVVDKAKQFALQNSGFISQTNITKQSVNHINPPETSDCGIKSFVKQKPSQKGKMIHKKEAEPEVQESKPFVVRTTEQGIAHLSSQLSSAASNPLGHKEVEGEKLENYVIHKIKVKKNASPISVGNKFEALRSLIKDELPKKPISLEKVTKSNVPQQDSSRNDSKSKKKRSKNKNATGTSKPSLAAPLVKSSQANFLEQQKSQPFQEKNRENNSDVELDHKDYGLNLAAILRNLPSTESVENLKSKINLLVLNHVRDETATI